MTRIYRPFLGDGNRPPSEDTDRLASDAFGGADWDHARATKEFGYLMFRDS